MSYEATALFKRPPTAFSLGTVLSLHDWSTRYDDLERSPWPDGVLALHREGVSTRPVELSWERGGVHLRILGGTPPVEYERALALLAGLAERRGAMLEAEDGSRHSANAFLARHDASWIARQVRSDVGFLIEMAAGDSPFGEGAVVQIVGPNRTAYLGPRTLARLRSEGPEDLLPARVINMLRLVQWPERPYVPGQSYTSRSANGKEFLWTPWGPEQAVLLPNVESVNLETPRGQLLVTPAELVAVRPKGARWLDEVHVLADAVPREEWNSLLMDAALMQELANPE